MQSLGLQEEYRAEESFPECLIVKMSNPKMSNPKMSNEVLIRSKKALTGLQFLLRQEFQFMYFSTNENLRLLATAETIYVDGTFEICPRLFYQVFTINAFVRGQQFPLVYGLLP